MAELVLKNNYFEFNGQVKHQISGTAIDTKFAPTYAWIFMYEIETKFLQTQEFQQHGSGILTMFSLFGPMVQINLCHL